MRCAERRAALHGRHNYVAFRASASAAARACAALCFLSSSTATDAHAPRHAASTTSSSSAYTRAIATPRLYALSQNAASAVASVTARTIGSDGSAVYTPARGAAGLWRVGRC